MKTIWTLPDQYWVGVKGQCGSCGTKIELEDRDVVRPYKFSYTNIQDATGQVIKHHYVSFDATCPTCEKNIHLAKEID